MRDCRTKGETALHRAAAFASEETIQLLLDAGATIDAKDVNGDTPLSWASWYARADTVLKNFAMATFMFATAGSPWRHISWESPASPECWPPVDAVMLVPPNTQMEPTRRWTATARGSFAALGGFD